MCWLDCFLFRGRHTLSERELRGRGVQLPLLLYIPAEKGTPKRREQILSFLRDDHILERDCV